MSEEEKEKGAGQDDFLGSCLPTVTGTPPVRRLLSTVKSQVSKIHLFILVWASRLCRFRRQHYDLIGSTNLFLVVQYGQNHCLAGKKGGASAAAVILCISGCPKASL